jgi:hypothetical protein
MRWERPEEGEEGRKGKGKEKREKTKLKYQMQCNFLLTLE